MHGNRSKSLRAISASFQGYIKAAGKGDNLVSEY
jgi:hypothetical protein